jgi:PAS domain S-box-containing protein
MKKSTDNSSVLVVTERKHAEETLRQSEEFSKSILENSRNPIYVINADFSMRYANPAGAKLTGFATDEIIGKKPPYPWWPEEGRDEYRAGFDDVKDGKENIFKRKFVKKGGELFWVEISVSAVKENGELKYYLSNWVDITEKKKAEDALLLSEKKYRNLVENAPIGILIWSADRLPVDVNNALVAMHGCSSKEEFQAWPTAEHFYSADDRAKWLELVRERKIVRNYEARLKRRDGSIFWASLNSVPQVTDSGELQVINVVHDITEIKLAEQALKESESQLEALFTATANPMMLIDINGNILRANNAAELLYGFGRETLVGQKCRNLKYNHWCGTGNCSLTMVSATRMNVVQEFQIVNQDGETIKYMDMASPVTNDKGEVTGIVVVLIDVSDRTNLEELLLKEKERAEQYLESAKVILAMVDANETITVINREACEILGYKKEELIGKNWFDTLAPPVIREQRRALFRKILEGDETLDKRENYLLTKKGVEILGSFNNTTLFDENGRAIGRLMSGKDITEERRVEARLHVTMENFRTFAEVIPLGILILHPENYWVFYGNKAAVELFGYSGLDDFNKFPRESRYTAESIIRLDEMSKRFHDAKEISSSIEIGITRTDGMLRQVEVSVERTIWDDEIRDMLIFRDVTKEKELAEQLRHTQLLGSLGQMTAGIAHEVGNPLSSILLYSEAAMKENISRRTKKDLQTIHNEALRAGKLMRDLLAYSRKLETVKRRINLVGIIEKVVDIRRYQLQVQDITVTLAGTENPVFIRGNSNQLAQVFMNLFLNAEEALKSTAGGNIKVEVRPTDNWVSVVVSDDGPNIPKEFLDKIFLPFFTTKKVGEGAGLGLSICYGIITAHGGLISVENYEEGGVVFKIRLPLFEDRDTAGRQ